MLFLVFDIELVLLLPISVSLYQISIFGFVTAIIFFIILTIGFIFEIGVGALSLKSHKTGKNNNLTPNNKNSTNYNKIIFWVLPLFFQICLFLVRIFFFYSFFF